MNQEFFLSPIAQSLSIREMDLNHEHASPTNVLRLARPTRIAVSPRFPGRKFFTIGLNGEKGADEEALAALMISSVGSGVDFDSRMMSIMSLRELLLDSELTREVMNVLFPRSNTHLQRGTYYLTEESVYELTLKVVGMRQATAAPSAITVYSRLLARVLAQLGFLSAGTTEIFPEEDASYALSIHDLHRAYLIERLRPALSGTLLNAKLKDLDLSKKNAAAVMATRLGDAFQLMSSALLQVIGADREFSTAVYLTHKFISATLELPYSLQNSAELAALADLANITATLLDPDFGADGVNMDAFEYATAVRSVHTALWAVPSVEIITLEQYKQRFLVAPAMSPKGLVLGGVVAMPLSQKSELRVVQAARISDDSTHVEVLPPSIVTAPALAGVLNRTLNDPAVYRGLVHLAADSLVTATETEEGLVPKLMTVGVSDSELAFLAMARASELSLADVDGARALVFGINRTAALGVEPQSAIGNLLFFVTPADAVGFSIHQDDEEYKPMPQRLQSLPNSFRVGRVYGDGDSLLSDSIQQPFAQTFAMKTGASEVMLNLKVMLARRLANLQTERSRMAVVIEPGVALDACRQLALYVELITSDDTVIRHHAIGWLAGVLRIAMRDPQVAELAEQTLLASIVEDGVDARSLSPYAQRALFFAYVLTFVGSLTRLNVVTADIAARVLGGTNFDDIALSLGADLPPAPLHIVAKLSAKR